MQHTTGTEDILNVWETRYRRLFEDAGEGILLLDGMSGAIIDVNPYLVELMGYTPEEWKGKHLWEAGPFNDVEDSKVRLETLLGSERTRCDDLQLRTKDGRLIDVEFVANAYAVGTVKTIQCTIRDLTALKSVEKKLRDKELLFEQHLRRSQKTESLGVLAEGVAHQFNNVLAMILPAAEMITAAADTNTKLSVYAARIVEAANRGANIVKQLSIFARSDRGEVKPVSLQRIVLEIGSLLAHTVRKEIDVVTKISTEQTMVLGETTMLHQAVLNLSVNAVDAMRDAGTLTIELDDADDAEIERIKDQFTPGDDEKTFVVLRVRDTGVGIDEETKERMFDPFFTTKETGQATGLGLSIVNGIVKSHGGYLDVQTAPKAGTTVSIYLPVLQQEDLSSASAVTASPAPGSETILVIDDEEPIRDTLTEILSFNGYTVLTAADGIEGLQQLKTHHADIRLVISDLGMPRMNGEQFFAEAKKFDPALKIMVTTGYVHTQTRSKLLSLGVVDLIAKPFSIDTLLPAVRRAIDLP